MPGGDNLLYVIHDRPAFQLAYHSDMQAAGNLDIYSLRETFGIVDPGRTLRLTSFATADKEPAYGLDASRMAFVREENGSADVYLANAIAAAETNLTRPRIGCAFYAKLERNRASIYTSERP